jgi:hypothetical protein
MDLTLLATLKDRLIHAENFSQVWEYFLDHFGQDPDFIALGERTDDPFLEAVLTQVGTELFHREVTPTDFLLTRVPEHQFVHGGCILNGRLTNVLYFEDIYTGLLAVVMSVTPAETKLVRFTGRRLQRNLAPSQN